MTSRAGETRDGRAYRLRSARPGEAGALLDYYLEIGSDDAWSLRDPDENEVTADGLRTWMQRLEAAPNAFSIVAEAEEGIVAVLTASGGHRRRTSHVAQIGMSVRRAWRGQGVGRAMLEACVAEARGLDSVRRLVLEVVAGNTAAVSLYESVGFRLEGRRPGHVHLGEGYEDLLLMGLTLG